MTNGANIHLIRRKVVNRGYEEIYNRDKIQ